MKGYWSGLEERRGRDGELREQNSKNKTKREKWIG